MSPLLKSNKEISLLSQVMEIASRNNSIINNSDGGTVVWKILTSHHFFYVLKDFHFGCYTEGSICLQSWLETLNF